MSRFRFSLLGLAGLVALIALGCAALTYASPLLTAAVWWVVFLSLMFAALAVVLTSATQRSWWIGFAMFGWILLVAMHGPLSGVDKGLQTDSLLQKAAMTMPKAMITSTSVNQYRTGIAPDGTGFTMPITIQTVDTEYLISFARIGQALLTLLLACLGGIAGRSMHERNAPH